MLLAQNCREDGKVVGDFISGRDYHSASFNTHDRGPNNKNMRRQNDVNDNESLDTDRSDASEKNSTKIKKEENIKNVLNIN